MKYCICYLFIYIAKKFIDYYYYCWGLGIGDWGLGIGPNPQSPIPNPQSPIKLYNKYITVNLYTYTYNNILISL